jgi:hypothetical protein
MGELARVVSGVADYSFSVPHEELPAVLKNIQSLRSREGESEPGKFARISLDVREGAGAAQEIHLLATVYEDHENESWYLADGRNITPRFHREYADVGVGIGAAFVAPIVTLPVALVFGGMIALWRSRRRRKKGDNPPS